MAKELGDDEAELPQYISIAPYLQFNQAAYGPGFLGPKYAPATVDARRGPGQQSQTSGYADLRIENLLTDDATAARLASRAGLWQSFESDFLASHRAASAVGHETVYRRGCG